MKIRNGFVSNSSSQSFLCVFNFNSKEKRKLIQKLQDAIKEAKKKSKYPQYDILEPTFLMEGILSQTLTPKEKAFFKKHRYYSNEEIESTKLWYMTKITISENEDKYRRKIVELVKECEEKCELKVIESFSA